MVPSLGAPWNSQIFLANPSPCSCPVCDYVILVREERSFLIKWPSQVAKQNQVQSLLFSPVLTEEKMRFPFLGFSTVWVGVLTRTVGKLPRAFKFIGQSVCWCWRSRFHFNKPMSLWFNPWSLVCFFFFSWTLPRAGVRRERGNPVKSLQKL